MRRSENKHHVQLLHLFAIIPILWVLLALALNTERRMVMVGTAVALLGVVISSVFSLRIRTAPTAHDSLDQRLNKVTQATQIISDLGPYSVVEKKIAAVLNAGSVALGTDMITLYSIDSSTGCIEAESTQEVDSNIEESFLCLFGQRLTDRSDTNALLIDNIQHYESQMPTYQGVFSSQGVARIVACPISSDTRIVGALVGYFKDKTVRPEELICGIQVLAAQASTALSYTSSLEESRFMVEELAGNNQELSLQATADGLTGLHNHRKFQQELNDLCNASARKPDRKFCVIMADVDHFKIYNDTFGHRQGDAVLQKVSLAMADGLKQGDIAARYGGEEFAMIILRTDKNAAYDVAERIRSTISQLPLEKGAATVSMGVAEFPTDGTSPGELIECADRALYQAKKSGRNRVFVWETPAADSTSDRANMKRKAA
jgi:diguanylate cyclase (GGDEF)-like protein